MNGTHQVLAYADVVNVIRDDIRTIERNSDVLLNDCNDVGLAVNTGKSKYMEIGRNRGMIANEHIKIASNSYKKSENFKYCIVYCIVLMGWSLLPNALRPF